MIPTIWFLSKCMNNDNEFLNIVSHLNVFLTVFYVLFCKNNCTKAARPVGNNKKIFFCHERIEDEHVVLKYHLFTQMCSSLFHSNCRYEGKDNSANLSGLEYSSFKLRMPFKYIDYIIFWQNLLIFKKLSMCLKTR